MGSGPGTIGKTAPGSVEPSHLGTKPLTPQTRTTKKGTTKGATANRIGSANRSRFASPTTHHNLGTVHRGTQNRLGPGTAMPAPGPHGH